MIRRRKIVVGIIACAFAVSILLLGTILVAPKVIDSEAVKAKVRSEIKETAGIVIDLEHLVLNFFPHLHLLFDRVAFSIPSIARGKAVSLTVHPKILPLFLGKMQIAGLHLDSAELDYTHPEKPAKGKTTPQPISYYNLAKRLQSIVAGLPEFKIPDLDFQVNNSSANLFIGTRKFLELAEVNSHLTGPLAGRKITIRYKSNRWQRISFSGLLDARTFRGSGQIQLTQFRPKGLVADLFPDSLIRITDAPANLTIDFKTNEPGQLQAELNGSSPHLKFHTAKEALNIENLRINAAIQIDKNPVSLSLAELALDRPQLNLSANLALTQSTPPLSLQVKGSQIDVASTRQMVLALAEKNDDVKDLVLQNMPGRPGPLKIASAICKADPHTLGYTDGQISLLDGVWKISGAHKNYFNGLDKDVQLKFGARLGSKSVQWLSKSFDLPDEIHIRPLTLSTSHINYVRNEEKTISANLAIQGGLKISTDLVLGSDKLVVKKLFIQDKVSRATMEISLHKDILTLSFKGNLHKTTLEQLTTGNPWLAGWLEGDFNAHINMEHPLKSAAWGELKGKEVIYPWKPDSPVKINDFAVTATTHKISLTSADLAFRGNRLQAAGNMTRSAQKVLVNMDITADTVDLDPLIQALKNSGEKNGPKTAPSLPVKGSIRFKADRFTIGKFTWNPLHADIRLNNDTAAVTLKKAVLCGISTPGTLKVSPPNIEFDLEAVAKDQKLDPAKTCLVGKTFKADGTYNLKGKFQGRGKAEVLLKTATGQVAFRAQDRHIYHDFILLEVLKFLNTLEVFEGRANPTDMKEKGFGYHSFGVKAKLQDGKLRYDEAVLHGRPMTVTAAGEHNLQTGRFDLTLLVAPLVTLDRIFEHIPLIGGILEAFDTSYLGFFQSGTLNPEPLNLCSTFVFFS